MQNIQEAWAGLAEGKHEAAAAFAQRALQKYPGSADLYQLLAVACFQQGRDAEALEAYRTLTTLQPKVARHWQDLATAARAAGQTSLARDAYNTALSLGADTADLHWNYALLLWDASEIPLAYAHLERAYAQQPLDAGIALSFAQLSADTIRLDAARSALGSWRQWQDMSEQELGPLSGLALKLGEVDEAEAILRLALTLNPDDARSQVRLAGLFERSNRLDEAASALQAAATASLDEETDFERRATQARLLQRQSASPEALELIESLLTETTSDTSLADLYFMQAKGLEALKRYPETLTALEAAHAAQLRQVATFTPKAVSEPAALKIADFDASAADIARWRQQPGATEPLDPLFVVGFPRSGTTLLEQMLDAHQNLRSMDEQPFLPQTIGDMQAFGVRYPEELAALSAPQLQQVREAYWARVHSKVQVPAGTRLVDKNPLNMLRLPAIQRLFPEARIILVIRHPFDVLLSCYMQNFRAPEFAVLCQSLQSLAEGYDKAFSFWYRQQALLKSQVFELRYESMVADIPGTARALCDFAGLPWDERMLDPTGHAQQKGYISTPSYTQVVKPVSRGAVNRWRAYEQQFQPLVPLLKPHLDRWGYSV